MSRRPLLIVGSLAARVPIPFQALYWASKAAVASYTEALRQEVMAFGVHVSVVDPGDHATAFGASKVHDHASRLRAPGESSQHHDGGRGTGGRPPDGSSAASSRGCSCSCVWGCPRGGSNDC
ncbi:MAG: SDR family NAD(P)-dependent oxidoreductase [Myxococcota bacterium]